MPKTLLLDGDFADPCFLQSLLYLATAVPVGALGGATEPRPAVWPMPLKP